jgi:hypothetical protein
MGEHGKALAEPRTPLQQLCRDLADAAMSVTHHDIGLHETEAVSEVQSMERKFRRLIRSYEAAKASKRRVSSAPPAPVSGPAVQEGHLWTASVYGPSEAEAIRMRDAVVANQAAPVIGSGALREAVARIIDPDAWRSYDKHERLWKVEPSLAKADAILALTPPAPALPAELVELAEKAKDLAASDHDRGCAGRCYSCSCGYDDRVSGLLEDLAKARSLIASQAGGLGEDWRDKDEARGEALQFIADLDDPASHAEMITLMALHGLGHKLLDADAAKVRAAIVGWEIARDAEFGG